jgi:predicted dehydrogenase
MKKITRRNFVKGSMATSAALALQGCSSGTAPFARVRGANEDIRVAVIGFRGKGGQHIKVFSKMAGVRIVALSDADQNVIDKYVKYLKDKNINVDTYKDMRHIMDDKNIDAVITATPNHWHSLVTVWACQAGKDVYVEKPVCHNIFEGIQMVKAARKYNRIVQAGTQNRSDIGIIPAFDYIKQGHLGKVLYTHALCFKNRKSIGKVAGPQPFPEGVDQSLWTGPAPLNPLRRTRLHYDWHWDWDTGSGDIGNQGIHEMDLCRWVCGYNEVAPRVLSLGGRLGYDDDGETPNTQIAILDYDEAPMIMEVRGLPRKKGVASLSSYMGMRVGIKVQCENGYFAGGRGGAWIYDNKGNKIKQFKGDGGGTHTDNFIECVRSRRMGDLKAEVREGFLSSALCHMANISYRIGQECNPNEAQEAIKGNAEALATFDRIREHLDANEIDLGKTPLSLGPWLKMNTEKLRFEGTDEARRANQLLTRNYRKPFVVPKRV